MKKLLLLFTLFLSINLFGQFPGFHSASSSTTEENMRGMFSADKGLKVYPVTDTTAANTAPYIKTVPFIIISTSSDNKYWYRNATATKWLGFGGSATEGWSILGNTGTTAGTNFLGTTDDQDVVLKRNSIVGLTLKTGLLDVPGNMTLPTTTSSSTGVIYKGINTFLHNFNLPGTSGRNTFLGINAGNLTMTGSSGSQQGSDNTGIGPGVLNTNTTGFRNTVIGSLALQNNTTGNSNTAVGYGSLFYNSTGQHNLGVGIRALQNNTTGDKNYAFGTDALFANITGTFNTGISIDALYQNTTGSYNTAVGDSTAWIHTIGIKNTFIGSRAGYYLGDTYPNFGTVKDNFCLFVGADASRDSSIPNTTVLTNLNVFGYNAKGFASDQVVLGNNDVTSTLFKGAMNNRNYGSGANTGTATYNLQVDASGNIIEGALGGSGANTTLSNLASVAVNTSLLPGTDNSIDLGSGAKQWRYGIFGSGGISIGTAAAPSTGRLQIATSGAAGGGITLTNATAGNYSTMDFYNDGGFNGQFLFTGSTYSNGFFNGNQLAFGNYAAGGNVSFLASSATGYIKFGVGSFLTGAEVMRVTSTAVGIGTASPTSKLHVAGSFALPYRKVTSDADLITGADYTLSVDNVGNNWGITLPDATTCSGRIYVIKRFDETSVGKITVSSAGGNVQSQSDGIFSSTYDIQDTGEGLWGGKFSMAKFQSNGTDWEAIK